jgi:hypothetical protein
MSGNVKVEAWFLVTRIKIVRQKYSVIRDRFIGLWSAKTRYWARTVFCSPVENSAEHMIDGLIASLIEMKHQ